MVWTCTSSSYDQVSTNGCGRGTAHTPRWAWQHVPYTNPRWVCQLDLMQYIPVRTHVMCASYMQCPWCLLDRDIVITSRQEMEEICNFTIVLAHDCTVYKKDVLDQMEREAEERAKKGDNREQAIMLLIPMRLGVDKLNPIYIDNIRFLLSLDQSLGIIGGRPKHSLYFVGYQGMEAWS